MAETDTTAQLPELKGAEISEEVEMVEAQEEEEEEEEEETEEQKARRLKCDVEVRAELWWHEDREDLEDICEHINALWHRDHEDEQSGEDRAVEKACYELLSRDELPDYHRIFLSIRIASYADTLDKKLEYYESGLHWVAVLQGKLEGVGARDERVTKMKMMLTRSREGVLQEKSELQQGAPDDPDNAAPAPTGPPILIKANEIDLLTYG